ncbi:MAG: Stk1 family PASTA domain-containing Ser/Thr kinase [Actinomycetota bacterium]|nr:Stk1 family PASTA domain-containing Ser/Thr kinase [Actinomycetota bacterium]
MVNKIFGGRYRIAEKIGMGGMAEVYKAFDTTLDRTVAVKVLHPQFAAEEDFVARFRREAQAAANLSQPNIVNVYDWGSEQGTYYIVMEYLVGRNLKQIINEEGPLPPNAAIDIARQVAAALHVAHKHGIVHRDIKPHNIVITDEGEVKVTDFGIARSSASNVTQTGAILGTAQYISPEQAKGDEVGAASDIYSLGIVIYEMLAGKVPFNGDSPVAVALKQIQEKPIPLSDLNKNIPADLETIVAKTMAKNPAARYQSAAELRDDLGRAAEGLPVLAYSDGSSESEMTVVMPRPVPPERRKETTEKHPWRIAAFILALLLLFAGSAWATNYFMSRAARNEVPSLTGKTLAEAQDLAAKNKLKVEAGGKIFDDNTAAGHIVDQTPAAGEKLPAGGIISVRLSKGRQLVTVPDLNDKFQNEAMRTISNLGLRVGDITRDYNDRVGEDYVISSEPPANGKVAKGTYINLLVSRGPRPLKVPLLIGKTAAEARSTLASLGLVIHADEANDPEVEAGRVISQDPAQGVPINRGESVTVTVSKGPLTVNVPSVVGLDEASAKTTLQDAGFNVQLKAGVSGPDLIGKVVTQKPEADASAKKGATVTIWIGSTPDGP